ncbi:hypothetical protein LPB140_02365 [Sphingorhabdus lutea]|uniref:Solute-binding protein family 5 domain-containing protein n=1 Tax=Sphingorhabdus lutea TaxID=1913578 RepID=A0A1L3J9R5_9SPHN|nr:ABC transporter substrate-binding protein [Sphingorhabdus lutea]APG61860.1 hypothetical protein LPB140_02365 [Sphingorhabdus lutea]
MANKRGDEVKITSFLSLLLTLLFFAGCSPSVDNENPMVDIISQGGENFNVGKADLNVGSALLRASTAQGLVNLDKQGRIVPGLASRWVVSDDGLSFIFRLDHIWWKNGVQVEAVDIANALRQRWRALPPGPLADEMKYITQIKPMTGRVIEIRLTSPRPGFLEILAQPELGLTNGQFGSGPMQAKQSGKIMQLKLRVIDAKGQPLLDERTTSIRMSNAKTAIANYREGNSDLILNGDFNALPLLQAADISSAEIIADPVAGLYGLLVNPQGALLESKEARMAIAMAVDRPRLLTAYNILTLKEAVTLVPEAMPGRGKLDRPSWTNDNIETRKQQAREIIAGVSGNKKISLYAPNGPGNDHIFNMLKEDFAQIGIQLTRADKPMSGDLILVDEVSYLSNSYWYLRMLSCRYAAICSKEADQMVDEAMANDDLNIRAAKLTEAEAILQQQYGFIPISQPLRWNLVRPGLIGFDASPRYWHPLWALGNRDPI